MKRRSVELLVALMTSAVVFLCAGMGMAEDFPEREIRVIVPYSSGGASDIRARVVEKVWREKEIASQPMVVSDMNGGASILGQRAVRSAKPDGYVLLFHHGQLITGKIMGVQKWTYTDYEPVAQVTENPLFIITHKGSGYKTFGDVLAAAKKKPGTVKWAWSGVGGHCQFASEAVFAATGIKVRRLTLAGSAEQKTALAAGRIDVAMLAMAPVDYIKSGQFIPLAVLADQRMEQFPDVPTLKETGVDVSISIRFAYWAPKGTPESTLKILRGDLAKVCASSEFKQGIKQIYGVVKFRPGKELMDRFAKDAVVFDKVAKNIKLKGK